MLRANASVHTMDGMGRGIVFIISTCPPALSSISDSTIVFSISGCYCPVCLTIIARTRDPANEFDWLLTGRSYRLARDLAERLPTDNQRQLVQELVHVATFLISGTPFVDAPV